MPARIIDIGRGILQEVERDHACASRAQVHEHLPRQRRARTTEYARTDSCAASRSNRTRQLLVDMESTFDQQRVKLLEKDPTSLDVEIEVLNARLKREGVN
jgi:hypothetical protein